MPEKTRHKEPPHRVENGRKIYTIDAVVPGHARPLQPAQSAPTTNAGTTAPPTEKESEDPTSHGVGTRNNDPPGVVESADYQGVWRLISMVQAWPQLGWFGAQCVDYAHNNGKAIRDLVPLINQFGCPVCKNHTDNVDDQIGLIVDAVWEDSKDIPPGVNGRLVVPAQVDPLTAVRLQLGIIRAGSIGTRTHFERSHPDLDFSDFIDMQGHDVDGEIVRWLPVATEWTDHYALVQTGADRLSRERAEASAPSYHSLPPARTGETTTDNTNNTAAEQPEISAGGTQMDKNAAAQALQAVCKALGMEVILNDDGKQVPESLTGDLSAKIEAGRQAIRHFNELARGVQALAEHVKLEGDADLTSAEILNRLPERLALAKHGELYLQDLRQEAKRAYGAAKVDPDAARQPEHVQRMLKRIEASDDVEFLQDTIAEYGGEALNRFTAGGSAQMPPVPPNQPAPTDMTADEQDIREAVARLHNREAR